MSIDKILVSILSLAGILFTYWFFLVRNEKEVSAMDNSIDILVQGGYKPEVISIRRSETTKINFLRKDPSSCLEEVVLGDFKIRKFLPLNEKVSIEITPKQEGEYQFSCGMNMFHGKLVVR